MKIHSGTYINVKGRNLAGKLTVESFANNNGAHIMATNVVCTNRSEISKGISEMLERVWVLTCVTHRCCCVLCINFTNNNLYLYA